MDGTDGVDGVTPWTDNVTNLSTEVSIQIGDESVVCDSTTAGTIRFTGTDFEGCADYGAGYAWVSLSASGSGGAFACGVDQVEDADGNWYDTVLIGSQCWMAENLDVGTRIAGTSGQTDNGTTEKYCYDDLDANCLADGGLYQWDEMMQYSTTEGAQGICTTGWHLPTDSEWKSLEMALGMTQTQADSESWRGTDQGTQLKQGGSSGFQALLAGYRYTNGSFSRRGSDAVFCLVLK